MPVRLAPGFTSMKMLMPLAPLAEIARVLDQGGDSDLGEFGGRFPRRDGRAVPSRRRPQNVGRAGLANGAARAWWRQIADTARRHLAHRGNELRGLDVRAPAFGVAVQARKGALDVVVDNLGENQQGGRQQVFDPRVHRFDGAHPFDDKGRGRHYESSCRTAGASAAAICRFALPFRSLTTNAR